MVARGMRERRALAVVQMSASALRYQPRADRDTDLRTRIETLAQRHKCGRQTLCLIGRRTVVS